jgi:MFS family permease
MNRVIGMAEQAAVARPPREAAPNRDQSWLKRTFSALGDPNFRLLYVGNIMQFGSMQMQLVVRGWLVFHLTGSFAALGTMSLANAIPGLIFSPIGGVAADRLSKKTVIQAAQIFNVVNAAALAILAAGWFGLSLQFWHLFASAMLQGGVNSVMMPSRQSIISDLVGRDRLMNAIGVNSSGQTLMQLVGPGLAGFLIAVITPASVFWVMAAMYAIAVTFTMRLPSHPLYAMSNAERGTSSRGGRRGSGSFQDLIEGFRYVAHDPTIRMLIAVNFLIVVVAMPYTMLLPGFVREVLCREPECTAQASGVMQGTLQSVQGIGAIAGSMVIAIGAERGRGKMMLLWGAALGIGVMAFAASSSFWITLPIMVLIGAGQAGRMAVGQVLIQVYSEEQYRGRVMSVWFMQFALVQVGTFLIGILAEQVGPQIALGGTAALLVIAMVLVGVLVPNMRKLQ